MVKQKARRRKLPMLNSKHRKSQQRQHVNAPTLRVLADASSLGLSSQQQRDMHDVLEWLGDAVLGELVCRCLLSQFHEAPVSPRVFQNLHLGVVTNKNLAHVYNLMGYGGREHGIPSHPDSTTNVKHRADAVEAVIGEIASRISISSGKENTSRLEDYVDKLLASVFGEHFEKLHERAQASSSSSSGINLFMLLPDEELDEDGQVIVTGPSDDVVDHVLSTINGTVETKTKGDESAHHAFRLASVFKRPDTARHSGNAVALVVAKAMVDMGVGHALSTSKQIFDVFRLYGIAVLKDRISRLLLDPHLASLTEGKPSTSPFLSPAMLTSHRQQILAVSNLSKVANELGITQGLDSTVASDGDLAAWHERKCANSLRAFIGYHSAIAYRHDKSRYQSAQTTHELLDSICRYLFNSTSCPSTVDAVAPPRSIVQLRKAKVEVKSFVKSVTCDRLHAPGERPQTQENTRSSSLKRRRQEQLQRSPKTVVKKAKKLSALLVRFQDRRFLYCLEELVVLFAQHRVDECQAQMQKYESDLEPCSGDYFHKWHATSKSLVLAMRDSFFRLLVHEICSYHDMLSSSSTAEDGVRITELHLPPDYIWYDTSRRITNEETATS